MARVDPEQNREYQKRWYAKNKKLQMSRNAACKKQRVADFRAYKATLKCEVCGEDHPAALDFHHNDPSTKVACLAQLLHRNWGMKRLMDEVAKCSVMCSNCHRKLHWNGPEAEAETQPSYKGKEDGANPSRATD